MKISESGRSMVEMLGVLAVIGVLTVGGIIGYRYSVDRIMANRVVTGVRERAVIAGQQRVLGQPLNLKEFYPDTDTDLIYGRFEVEADNAYVNLAYGFTADMGVQAITVYDLPQRVCEYVRETDFPDPVLRLVNGREMDSSEVECLPDGRRGADTGLTNAQGFLDGEYRNVVTFVFDEPLKSPCETDSECLPCRQCNDGYCEAKEESEGKVCSYGACCKAGLCDPNGCECPPDDPRPESGCWIERTTDAEPPCPGHKTYEPCACSEGWSTTEEPCAGTVNTQTISGYNGVSLTCYQCQECPKGNTCPNGTCCTETEHAATDDCPAYKTYTPTTCECSAGFSKAPCGDGQMTKETETLKDGTVCYQCQECPTSNECLQGTCCKEETVPANSTTGCPAYTKYTPTTCKCSEGTSATCENGQVRTELKETLGDGTKCYTCGGCDDGYTANACDNGYTATETKTVTDIEDNTKVLTCRKCEQCTPLYKNKRLQQENGCCPKGRLVSSLANVLFSGYNFDKKRMGCCAEGNNILNGVICCPPERTAGNTCCQSGDTVVDGQCCSPDRVYEENGVEKCCPEGMRPGNGICYKPIACSKKRKEGSDARKPNVVQRSDVQLAAKAHGMDEYAYIQKLCSHGQSYTYNKWNAWVLDGVTCKKWLGYLAKNSGKKDERCGTYTDQYGNKKTKLCRCLDKHSKDDKFHWLCYGEKCDG